ncbi:MAG: phosphoribosyltransferase family protein [Lachnospiraceae bacterium]|nr:phosphoribosyltransferase family protein [Lachnospiraceae bacterium]
MQRKQTASVKYTEQELAAVAKRENNKKRSYLVVNRLQGKHVPVSPGKALRMFGSLAELLLEEYQGERLLLIGFAETATAIGAAVAEKLGALYIQTTREQIQDVEYFYFSEQHSHATEQKLVKDDLDRVMERVDRIIFIEDEITTGNTIRNIIELLKKAYPGCAGFSAASLLNGMAKTYQEEYAKSGIRLHWLLRTCHDSYEERAADCRGDGICHGCDSSLPAVVPEEYRISGCRDARRLTDGTLYKTACRQMGREAVERLQPVRGERILVIGTEEFMYPALVLASILEEKTGWVRCHSTTRSPILVSSEAWYPLHERYELRSLYDRQRTTFLYDLSAYDRVCMVTDAGEEEKEGLYSLINALVSCGNERICVIRWCQA